MVYNPVTCKGWEEATTGWFANGGCLSGRLGFVLLFFIVAMMRKWVFEMFQIPYNLLAGIVGAELSYLIVIILFGNFKWAFAIGLIMAIVGGVLGAMFMGSSEDGGD